MQICKMAETHRDLDVTGITKTCGEGNGTMVNSCRSTLQENKNTIEVSRTELCSPDFPLNTDKSDSSLTSSNAEKCDCNPNKEPPKQKLLPASSDSMCTSTNGKKTFEDSAPHESKIQTDENCAEHLKSKLSSLKISSGLPEINVVCGPPPKMKNTAKESAKNDVDRHSKRSSDMLRFAETTDTNLVVETQKTLEFACNGKTDETIKTTADSCNITKSKILTDTESGQTQTNVEAPSPGTESKLDSDICLTQNGIPLNGVDFKDEQHAIVTPPMYNSTSETFVTDQNAEFLHNGNPSVCQSPVMSFHYVQTRLPLGEQSTLTDSKVISKCEKSAGLGDTQTNVTEITHTVPNIKTTVVDNIGATKGFQNGSSAVTFTCNAVERGRRPNLRKAYTKSHPWSIMTREQIPRYSWTPEIVKLNRSLKKPSYNTLRRRKYVKTSADQEKLDNLIKFYENKVQIDSDFEEAAMNLVDDILENILNNTYLTLSNQFAQEAHDEGSVTVDTKVGKLDESDHSLEILLEDRDVIILSDEPFLVDYSDDDIDTYVINEISATAFVSDGKRLFPNESRPFESEPDPVDIPVGHVAVRLRISDAERFTECCISRYEGINKDCGWFLPYHLLSNFHRGIGRSLTTLELDGVTLNNGARGPAITLTIQQQNGPNISVDITPKLSLPSELLNVMNFQWPRKDTKKWLTKAKIKKVIEVPIYLVPKGDKYWKISFANLENELLEDIDDKGTWRKECLKIMKKKLIQWKSKSKAGLKGLSSYLLKTTLL